MKRSLLILFLLGYASLVSAQVSDFNEYESLDMKVGVETTFEMLPLSSASRVEFVTANLSFFPGKSEATEVLMLTPKASPLAEISKEGGLFYKWMRPEAQKFEFGFEGLIRVTSGLAQVKEKVEFPLVDSFEEYTSGTEFIDITPEIRRRAAEIAEGEEDAFVVAFKVAEWVEKNVEYDLSTLTADVVKPSSWVLANRKGVCDELTNLFISMMRSLGVPARFVSGVAYTNLGGKWGPHGWAEVYLDGRWVPFDVTYGQFGWIDPTHVRMKVAADSGDASIKYVWRAFDAKFSANEVEISGDLSSRGDLVGRHAEIVVKPLVEDVGPGSFVPVEVSVKNLEGVYLPEKLVVTKAPELVEENVKFVLLRPGETRKVYWTVRIPERASEGVRYATLFEVEDVFHTAGSANVTYLWKGDGVSREEAAGLVETEGDRRVLKQGLVVECHAPDYAFSYEKVGVVCEVRNTGNIIQEVEVCLKDACNPVEVSIAEKKEVRFEVGGLKLGVNRLEVVAENEDLAVGDAFLVNVLSDPDLVITNFNIPEVVAYSENFNLSFIMSVKAPVENVSIKVNEEGVVFLPRLEGSKRVVVSTFGNEYVKRKSANVTIGFSDRNGKGYEFSRVVPVRVEKVPLLVRLVMWLRLV